MITPQRHPDPSFTPAEMVRLRRSLVTAGEWAECPRCRTPLSMTLPMHAAAHSEGRVHCDCCGSTLVVPDLPGVLRTA